MEIIALNAKTRTITGKKVKNLRTKGELPAVLYGQGKNAQSITISQKEFIKIFQKAGISSLVDLCVDGKPAEKILIHEPQVDPLDNLPIHVDLYKIRMDKELTTEIPLEFTGIAPAVKELEGIFIKNKEEVEVECLPANLIPKIEVNISALKTFEDSIRVKDLQVPSTIKILDDPEDTVALVNPPRSEEELKAMEAEAAADTEKAGIEKMETESEAEKAAREAAKEVEKDKEGTAKPEAGVKKVDAKSSEPVKKEEKK